MHFLVSLLALVVSLGNAAVPSLLGGRQEAAGNANTADLIAQCAPYPFTIHQFTTLSGSDIASPEISFFFTNDNGIDVTKGVVGPPVFCSVTLPNNADVMDDDAVWSCEVRFIFAVMPLQWKLTTATPFQKGTGFRFDTKSVLTLSQSMVCDALWTGCVLSLPLPGSTLTPFCSEHRSGL